jgi:hypothetical protein
MTWLDALWIGVFQVFSLFPGISRSGSVITGGMTRGFKRKPAGQFGFLMAIPILLAASFLGILDLIEIPELGLFAPIMLTGFVTAAIIGYLSIRWLITYISQHSLIPFAGYCILLGLGSLVYSRTSNSPALISANIQENETIFIQVDPELTWLNPILNGCSETASGMEWVFTEALNDQHLSIHLDESVGKKNLNFLIGSVPVNIITNSNNSLESLNSSLINSILSGQISSWQELYIACPACFQNSELSPNLASTPIQIWLGPPESIFNAKILDSLESRNRQPAMVLYAPESQALAMSVASDPASIGFLPIPAMNDSVKTITSSEVQSEIVLQVFATIQGEPSQKIEDWLVCIQEELRTL